MILKKDKNYIKQCLVIAEESKCLRAKYGSMIISKDDRPISSGRNGKPRHACNDGVCSRLGLEPNSPKKSCCLHSEENAILFSNPLERIGGTMYVSGVPCNDCALKILQLSLARLVFLNSPESLSGHVGSVTDDFWQEYGVPLEVVKFTFEEWEELYEKR